MIRLVIPEKHGMTTRRHFLQTLASIPPALALRRAWATESDPARIALVIGNSAYRGTPLINPVNDARAMASLFGQAGFTVDSRLDASRSDMLAAIDRFGSAVKRPETRQVVFYYAGHGVQLDWRNFLLPVDAVVETAAQVKQRCIDLGLLLGQLGAAKDKTFIIILDACRNDPFGNAYKPEQKGLSQFDAPVGSLIAYATSPGNVASDGQGKNGLYTENLVRELSQRGTRLEDALKRVRLNVRLASRGAQIPWETTSLETDVFLFREGQKKLSDAELEKELEADIETWTRIKASRKTEDWVAYLHDFPNGRFAEIAQMRLSHLLADTGKATVTLAASRPATAIAAEPDSRPVPTIRNEAEYDALPKGSTYRDPNGNTRKKWEADPIVSAAAPAAKPAGAAIDIRPGSGAPQLMVASVNPFSAGRYPLGRIYTVGDEATLRETDILTDVEKRIYSSRVTRVDVEADRVEFNQGSTVTDLMGNALKTNNIEYDVPVQFSPAEIQVGKKWRAAFVRKVNGQSTNAFYDIHIVRRERIHVSAGEFDAFKLEAQGWNTTYGARLEMNIWLVPGLIFPIRREWTTRSSRGQFTNTERHELVSLRQQAIGL